MGGGEGTPIFFALLEADSLSAISRLMMSMPLPQQVKIIPVEHWLEGIVMAAQNQGCAFHSVSFPLWGWGVFFWENPESILDCPD